MALGAVVLFLGLWCCETTAGQDADVTDREIAKQLLTDFWPKGRESLVQGQQLFEKAPSTPTVLASYTIERMQLNRNRQAAEVARKWVEAAPADSLAWFTAAWLSIITDDFDRAVEDLRRWSDTFPQNNLPPDLQSAMLRQVGRLLGFMEGPVSQRVNPDTLAATAQEIEKKLPPDQWQVVDEVRQHTLAKFQTFAVEKDDVLRTQKEQAIREQQQERTAVEQEIERMQKRFDSLGTERQQIESDVSNRIAQLESQAIPLQQSAAGLRAEIDSITLELQRLVVQLTLLQNQACDRPNDQYLNFLIIDVNRRLRDLDYRRSIAQANLGSVLAQLNALDQQAAAVRQQGMARVRQLEQEADEIRRRLRWSNRKLVKLAQPPKIRSSKVGAIENRATSLTSYTRFPLEMVRDYLLDQL